jgi:uncharacterized protein YraI
MIDGPSTGELSTPERGPLDAQAPVEPSPPRLEPRGSIHARRRRAAPAALSSRWDAWLPLLNNRVILSGLGLVIVLLLIAIVLVAIGSESQDTDGALVTNRTPAPNSTVLPRGSLSGRLVTTTSVRNGPDATYAILGTVPRGATVAVIGRNEDESWLQIRYPPGSALLGWVHAEFLETIGDVSKLAVAGPGPSPDIVVPTQAESPTAVTTEEVASTPTEEATPDVTSTPTEEAKATPTEELATPTVPPEPTATPGP